jgi:hypothetical protein|tara:strand:+ start:561 stop:848 length:288 start_codon:yes stop_codon:yes gene_type:complete
MKLLEIKKSTKSGKKLMAIFEKDNGRTKTIHFGQEGAKDFIKTGDEDLKRAYIARHRVNENFNDPDTAGALARWILWNKRTLKESIADYKKRFGL